MKVMKLAVSLIILLTFGSCISEDIVDDEIVEIIRINNSFSNFNVGSTVILDAAFFDNQGIKQTVDFNLSSQNPTVLEIDTTTNEIIAKAKGTSTLLVSTVYGGKTIENSVVVTVNELGTAPAPTASNIKIGTISKTSSYDAAGDFEITEITGGIRIKFASNYRADRSLPGFAMYLTNNPNLITNALKIDSQGDADGVIYSGAFSIDVMGVGINDFGYLTHWCEPFRIKVGVAEIKNK
ncbi:hypothetical protein [Flavobacterium sp. 14A]|uniref:hypothetical protein n=1 Tax=Flavobacterium sp. 14A TaxID=2735896 RepID=UPI00156DB252|nr:hypothetical protein [Flavobacterium sp. 14A]NRT10630.1 hypothetical protein [Flavobacterium sp. 14A]